MSLVLAPAPAAPGAATRAIGNIVLAVALFAVMDAMVKWLSATYPVIELVFFRAFFALIPLSLVVARDGGWRTLKTRRIGGHAVRTGTGLISMGLFFLAFATMPLADAVAIAFAGPLFLTVLSIPLLGEQAGPPALGRRHRRFPRRAADRPARQRRPRAGRLLPLGGALGFALAMISVRRLSTSESNAAIVFYFSITATLVSAAALPFVWVMPAPQDWLPLIALGLIGGTAQLFMTQAFRLAPAAVVAPFEYTAIIWAISLGYLLFGDMPDSWTLAGAGVVIASGLYILHRETVRRAERARR